MPYAPSSPGVSAFRSFRRTLARRSRATMYGVVWKSALHAFFHTTPYRWRAQVSAITHSLSRKAVFQSDANTLSIEKKSYMLKMLKPKPVLLHKTAPQVMQEIQACIGCNECLLACPALSEPITIDVLNHETISGAISPPVARFARACYQCGACVSPCPVGLHRDAMMMWLKVRLWRAERGV